MILQKTIDFIHNRAKNKLNDLFIGFAPVTLTFFNKNFWEPALLILFYDKYLTCYDDFFTWNNMDLALDVV